MDDSGIQARRREDEDGAVEDEGDVGVVLAAPCFCWTSAMKPGTLSFADGLGWT